MIFMMQYSTRKIMVGKAKSTRANGKMYARNVRKARARKDNTKVYLKQAETIIKTHVDYKLLAEYEEMAAVANKKEEELDRLREKVRHIIEECGGNHDDEMGE
jgi:hypothetical protein